MWAAIPLVTMADARYWHAGRRSRVNAALALTMTVAVLLLRAARSDTERSCRAAPTGPLRLTTTPYALGAILAARVARPRSSGS